MSWKKNKYIFLLLIYAALFVLIMFGMPRQIDWTPSYSEEHTKPYGCHIVKNELHQLFNSDVALNVSNSPIYNTLGDSIRISTSFIAINQSLDGVDDLDMNVLFDFVASGNQAFLSAEEMPRSLLDSLGLSTLITSFGAIEIENPVSFGMDASHTFQLNVLPNEQWEAQSNVFTTGLKLDSSEFPKTVLGTFNTQANFVGVSIGKGTLYLHSFPLVFTNFNMLKDDQIQDYVAACFSYLEGDVIVWDEYYKEGKMKYAKSPLATLLKYQSTRWGIYLALIGILLFMVFTAKRNQRIIPVLDPYKNESVAFSKTLGDLYFQNQDHTDLANKKVKYFKDFVFEKYRIKNIKFEPDEVFSLARKSGHQMDFVESLFKMLNQVNSRTAISSEFLQAFSKKLHFFYYGK